MLGTIFAICNIFQCPRLDVTEISSYTTYGKEILAFVKMP